MGWNHQLENCLKIQDIVSSKLFSPKLDFLEMILGPVFLSFLLL